MSVDRSRLRDTVNYLREVRPIDPEEIQEYFDDAPHPAVVRQALREEAFDLDLAELADGTFVPATDEPVDPPGWAPDELPSQYESVVVDRLVERFGPGWADGESGDKLREAIRRLKADYYHGNPVEYDETAALGYAIYHLPDYYAAMGYVLDDLAENGDLPRKLRVLDVGAGVGGPALALIDYLHAATQSEDTGSPARGAGEDDGSPVQGAGEDEEPPLIEYHALEPSPAADLLEDLLAETPQNVRTTVHRETAEAFDPESIGHVDLLTFCNVLSELDDPVATAERYLDSIAEDGTLLAMAPADLETATGLREVERALARPSSGPSVYSPTLRLWPDESPSDRGWSFDVRPDVEAPSMQERLEQGNRGPHADVEERDEPGTYLKTTVQFAYALLRPDGKRRTQIVAAAERHAKAAEMERHVSNRIDLLTVKLSPDLSRQGERTREYGTDPNPVFKIGDGSEDVEQYAVLTRPSGLNRALQEADYGAVLSIENALALWNDDEEAYNLVVDGETVVDLVVP